MNEHQASTVVQAGLHTLLSRELDPVFWTPERMGLSSAWWAHVPFAFWITATCKPRLLVELGTHNGISYAAFCEAVLLARLGTRCYAVDTWAGDEHAGHYSEHTYNDLRDFHDKRYAAFSELVRSTFDDALTHFEDGSIDLLHIDGYHTHEAVRHDFESWRPKLSDRAVVLLHDTNVRRDDFGVYRFFAEIKKEFPSFEFSHGFGLGVLAVGAAAPAAAQQLCSLTREQDISTVRERFSHLGARWLVTARESLSVAAAEARIAEAIAQGEAAKAEAERARAQGEAAKAEAERARAEKETSERIRKRVVQRVVELRGAFEALGTESAEAIAQGEAAKAEAERARAQGEAAKAEAERARAEKETSERIRKRVVQQVVELRGAFEALRTESKEISAMLAALSRRYAAAVGPASGGARAKVRRVVRRLRGKSGPASSDVADTIRRSIYFDEQWYRAKYPDVAGRGVDPARHYAKHGSAEARDPGPWFSTRQYLESYPDVAIAGINALYHYERFGAAEGRSVRAKTMRTLASARGDVALPSAPGTLSLIYVSGEPDTPGNQYRVLRYIDAAAANGISAFWMRADELPQRMGELDEHDVLVIWRVPWNKHVDEAVELMRSQSKKIVFDVDDLMIEPDLAQTKIIDGIRSQSLTEDGVREHYARMRQTMLSADLCFTTTEELAFHIRWAGKVTHVLPNGFDQATHDLSRHAAREWRRTKSDGLIRMGYAGGSRTHQRDVGLAIEAIARLLRENASCRLVLFRTPDGKLPLVDVEEYPALAGLEDRIEWRPLQPLADLPLEMARFDINLAPLEFGNPFCEAKSELKFFEAALVEVPTVGSPIGPFRRAIEHGKSGFLAATADDWYFYLKQLVEDPALRGRIAREAYHASLAKFGPIQRAAQFGRVIEQLRGGSAAARAFALEAHLSTRERKAPKVFDSDVVFERDRLGDAAVTVIIPLYNYEKYLVEALESVRKQTLYPLDLVIVDGCSTDDSLAVAKVWAEKNAARFNRILVLRNRTNYGLGFCRNSGFDAADTPHVLPLDADNELLPDCCEKLLMTIRRTHAAYVYPSIQHFGASSELIGNAPYDPQRFVAGNYIDAMALVSKEAWAMIGGYDHVRHGWEDYDFWCRLAELGLRGEWHPEVLARYRVHQSSMMKLQTTVPDNYRRLFENFKHRHAWVSLVDQHTARRMPKAQPHLTGPTACSRIDTLVPILRCPQTKQKLAFNETRTALVSADGLRSWPILEGRPVFLPQLQEPEVKSADHISNDLPSVAIDLIRKTKGLVLNLSAGGSREKFDHVVEVEYAVFRHTDIVADAHELPFDDETFEAAIAMNAFEHYREPHQVTAELHRVLKPGGRILVHTAFMQPLHERPLHFFNCTRYGLAEWFRNFETDRLYVSDNFCPSHSIAWLASESEAALRSDVSAESADAFAAAPIRALVDMWRDPSKRTSPLWTDFHKLTQTTQEITAAGFEFVGRKPSKLPDLKASGGGAPPRSHFALQ